MFRSAPVLLAVSLSSVPSFAQDAGAPPQGSPGPAAKAAPGPVRKEAVLLGVSTGSELKTYLVDETSVLFLGDGLAVPRKDGFWYLDAHGGHLIARKGGKFTPQDFAPDDDTNCLDGMTATRGVRIEYVTADFVSFRWSLSKDGCESFAAHSQTVGAGTIAFDADLHGTSSVGDSIPIEPMLGHAASAALEKVLPPPEPPSGNPRDEGSPRGWVVESGELYGVWTEADETTPDDEVIKKAELPRSLRATLNKPSKLEHVEAPAGLSLPADVVPKLQLSSPSGRFQVLVAKDAIVVVAGEKPLGMISGGGAGLELVMEEWVYGDKNLMRWLKQTRQLLEAAAKVKTEAESKGE